MADETTRTCFECEGTMSPIVILDKSHPGLMSHRHTGTLEYHMPDDKVSFWTGKYPTAGTVQGFLCENCGRIALYGGPGA